MNSIFLKARTEQVEKNKEIETEHIEQAIDQLVERICEQVKYVNH